MQCPGYVLVTCTAASAAHGKEPARRLGLQASLASTERYSGRAKHSARQSPVGACWQFHQLVQTAVLPTRSEEHTSELQSQSNLVCRLLLEKKKKRNTTNRHTHTQHA